MKRWPHLSARMRSLIWLSSLNPPPPPYPEMKYPQSTLPSQATPLLCTLLKAVAMTTTLLFPKIFRVGLGGGVSLSLGTAGALPSCDLPLRSMRERDLMLTLGINLTFTKAYTKGLPFSREYFNCTLHTLSEARGAGEMGYVTCSWV